MEKSAVAAQGTERRVKRSVLGLGATLAMAMLLTACATGFDQITVITQRPPYEGEVEVIIGQSKIVHDAASVFMGRYDITRVGVGSPTANTTPTTEHFADIERIAARHGANVVVINCARSGTVGAGLCNVEGYYQP